jgi:hypothetical protein
MRYTFCAVAVLAAAACSPQIPDSAANVPDSGQGVGFGNYESYATRREAQLTGGAPAQGGAGQPPAAQPPLVQQQPAALNSGEVPVDASPSNPPPQIVSNATGISGENDFDAVSATRDIEADAALLAQNRAQYTVIQPTELPTRPGTNRPNIVAYALRTTNPVGTPLYRRNTLRAESRYQRACSGFASPDLAQEEFLALGGPERDRKGMDPDGDGFACGWNPAPFRAARG